MYKIPQYIKDAATNGNFVIIKEFLLSLVTKEQLKVFKEQKILFKYVQATSLENFKELSDCYLKHVENLPEVDYEEEYYYIDFIIATSVCKKELNKYIEKEFKNIKCGLECFVLEFTRRIQENYINNIIKEFRMKLRKLNNGNIDKEIQVGLIKNLELEFNGFLNDTSSSVTCVFYFASIFLSSYKETCKSKQLKTPPKACSISSKTVQRIYNFSVMFITNNYLIDKVCYGELKVKSVDWEKSVIQLGTNYYSTAPRRSGIRDNIFYNLHIKKNPRYIQEIFRETAEDLMDGFKHWYELYYPVHIRREYINNEINTILSFLSYRDELLFLSTKENELIKAIYLVGLYIQCLYSIIGLVDPVIKDSMFPMYEFPHTLMETYLSQYIKKVYLEKALNLYSCSLPLNHPKELSIKPLIKMPGGDYCLFHLVDNWTLTIHYQMIKGGQLGKLYGELFNEYLQQIFTQYGWCVVARDFRIKYNNQDKTDVDLIVVKNDITLLVQAKAVDSGLDIYDYWKTIQTIKEGIRQTKVADEFFKLDDPRIISLYKSNHVDTQKIKHVKNIIVITGSTFNGFNDSDIPIIGLGYLLSILNKPNITSQEYIDMLIDPLNYIAASYEYTEREINLMGFTYKLEDINFK